MHYKELCLKTIEIAKEAGRFIVDEQKKFNQTDIELIVERSSKEEINANLKAALKKRYSARWTFVQSNWGRIFPIDVQFFFNTNIRPELIYS